MVEAPWALAHTQAHGSGRVVRAERVILQNQIGIGLHKVPTGRCPRLGHRDVAWAATQMPWGTHLDAGPLLEQIPSALVIETSNRGLVTLSLDRKGTPALPCSLPQLGPEPGSGCRLLRLARRAVAGPSDPSAEGCAAPMCESHPNSG